MRGLPPLLRFKYNDSMEERLSRVIDRMPGWKGSALRCEALTGGITNRNYKVDINGSSFVVRLAGEGSARLGIDRRREHRCAKAAARSGLGPEVVGFFPGQGALVTRFLSGRPLNSLRARRPAVFRRIVSSIRRIHRGPLFPGRFSAFNTVLRYRRGALARGVRLPLESSLALRWLLRIEAALERRAKPEPCHNDLLPGNFIDDGRQVSVIDWEYAAMGEAYFDLGNLAANLELPPGEGRGLLNLYHGRAPTRAETARLELFRLVSDMREAFWGFLQAGVSELDFDFMKYGKKHLERFTRRARPPALDRWMGELHG